MNKTELVKTVAGKTEYSQKCAAEVLEAAFTVVGEALANKEDVAIPGFGKFSVAHREERTGRNPATGEPMTIKAANSVKFSAYNTLKDKVNA